MRPGTPLALFSAQYTWRSLVVTGGQVHLAGSRVDSPGAGLSREGTCSFPHGTHVTAGLTEAEVLLTTVVPCPPPPRLLYWKSSSEVTGGLVMAESSGLLLVCISLQFL